jgi:ketosteroid isomerase-like protein
MADAPTADQDLRIRTILERYFHAVDRRDFDLLGTCFTDDVDFEFNLETKIEVKGRDALIARFMGMNKPYASSHSMSNTGIIVSGNIASSVTFAVVHSVLAAGPDARVLIRGLRYDDDFVYGAQGWQIARRKHNPLWQYEAKTVKPGV